MTDEELVHALARLQFADTKIPWDDVDPNAHYLRQRYLERAARAVVFIRAVDGEALRATWTEVANRLDAFIQLVDQGNDADVVDVSGRWVATQLQKIRDEMDGAPL
jgi:hypothetical protein